MPFPEAAMGQALGGLPALGRRHMGFSLCNPCRFPDVFVHLVISSLPASPSCKVSPTRAGRPPALVTAVSPVFLIVFSTYEVLKVFDRMKERA